MIATMSKLSQLQQVAHDDTACCDLQSVQPFTDFELARSFESRRRYRAFISARQLLALFDDANDHRPRLH